MWALKVLNGNEVGHLHSLKEGQKYTVGRSSSCDIQVIDNGISKQHLEIRVFKEKLLVKDLNSSNGTFVNGVRISHRVVRLGDKIGLNEILLEAILEPKAILSHPPTASQAGFHPSPVQGQKQEQGFPPSSLQGQGADSMASFPSLPESGPLAPLPNLENPSSSMEPEQANPSFSPQSSSLLPRLFNEIQNYMEKVVLPGVYRLCQWFEFRWVLLSFLLGLVLVVVLLSLIPMKQLTQFSIQVESQRRALTIARNLAEINKEYIIQKKWSLLNIESAELEDGITKAFIVDKRGSILAPQAKMGKYLKLPFLQKLRRGNKSLASQIDTKTIVAGIPISGYNTELGAFKTQAYTVVVYNMGALAFDKGHVLSLFLQAFFLSLIFALLIFYFIYKVINYPMDIMAKALEKVLDGKDNSIQIDFRQESVQQVATHINSLLAKKESLSSFNSSSGNALQEKEVINLAQLIGFPAIVLNGDQHIVYANSPFEQLTNLKGEDIQSYDIQSLSDPALQQNIQSLMETAICNHSDIAVDKIEFNGDSYSLNCQCLGGEKEGPEADAYFFIVITPMEGEQEEEVA